MFTKIRNFIMYPWDRYKQKKKLKKRLEKLREQDPHIYE
jgi:hypothetical protein